MINITFDNVMRAKTLSIDIEKLEFALEVSEEYDEFFIILIDSFGYSKDMMTLMETTLIGAKISLDYDFLKVITDIEKRKSLLEASIFCISHFANTEFKDSMIKLFSADEPAVDRFSALFRNLLSLKENTYNRLVVSEIEKKNETQKVEIFQPTMLIPRKEHGTRIPVIRVVNKNNEFVRYIEGKNQAESEKVQKQEHSYRILQNWPQSHRGILGGEVRRLTRDYGVIIEKEGANRRVVYPN